jgi:hypothetical protein
MALRMSVLSCRLIRPASGQPMYEPCSPGSPNSVAVTLQQLADQGKASQVHHCACHRQFLGRDMQRPNHFARYAMAS